MKLESVKARHPQLLYESKLYKILQVPFYLILKIILIYAELYVGDDVDVDFGFGFLALISIGIDLTLNSYPVLCFLQCLCIYANHWSLKWNN